MGLFPGYPTIDDLSRLILILINHPLIQADPELIFALTSQREKLTHFDEKRPLMQDQFSLCRSMGQLISEGKINIPARQACLGFHFHNSIPPIGNAFLETIQTQICNQEIEEAWKNLSYLEISYISQNAEEYFKLVNLVLPSLPFTSKTALFTTIIPNLNHFPRLSFNHASFAHNLGKWLLSHRKKLSIEMRLQEIYHPAMFYFSQALVMAPSDTIHADASKIFTYIIEDSSHHYYTQLEINLEATLRRLLHLKNHFPETDKILLPFFQKARELSHNNASIASLVIQGLSIQEDPPPRTKTYLEKINSWQKLLKPCEPRPDAIRLFSQRLHTELYNLFTEFFLKDLEALLMQDLPPITLHQPNPHAAIEVDPLPPLLMLQFAIFGHPPVDHPRLTAAFSLKPPLRLIPKPSIQDNTSIDKEGDLFQALLAYPFLDEKIVDVESQLLSPLQKLLHLFSLHYKIEPIHPLDQIDCLPLDPQSKKILSQSYLNLYSLSLTPTEQTPLKAIYGLGLRPLFHSLKKVLHTEQLPSLYETAIQEIWWSETPDDFLPFIDVLVPHLIENQAPLSLHQKFYTSLSSKTALEPIRSRYIHHLKGQPSILQAIAPIPNRAGYRYEEKQQIGALLASIDAITQTSEPPGRFVAIHLAGETTPLYLKPQYLDKLLTPKGDIKKHYKESVHNVSPLENLHFKQKPNHPLMEYGVHTFTARIMGVATPPTLLARFTIDNKRSYPVLISQTIPGENLKDVLKKDPFYTPQNTHFTWQVLIDILLRPGDKRAANFIVNSENQLICIDNDISFVDPLVEKNVNFCSILFTLDSILDSSVLQAFCSLDPLIILERWLQDLLDQEKKYCALFSTQELSTLYTEDKEKRFTPTLLFPGGSFATLYTQFISLQSFLSQNKTSKLRSTDLLDALVTLRGEKLDQNRIGPYLRHYYQNSKSPHPEERLKVATQRDPNKSLISSRALGATIGKIPTLEEIHQKKLYSLSKAYEEFLCYSTFQEKGINLTSFGGQETISVDFSNITKENKPDLERQRLFLQSLQILKFTPAALKLTGCAVLTQENLKSFLHPGLTHLDIRSSPLELIPPEIETLSPLLEELHLNHCSQLKTLEKREGKMRTAPFSFPHLRVLDVARCNQLKSVQVNSSCIVELKANDNPQLEIVKIPFLTPNLTNSLQAKVLACQPLGKKVWATHLGDVGLEPPFPPNIVQILQAPCPFQPTKTVYKTHLLVLIPATINGIPLTLEMLGKLIQNPKQGFKTKYKHFDLGNHQDLPASQSYWFLMSRDLIQGSRFNDYKTQFSQVADLAKKTGIPYTVPKTREAAISILLHYIVTGERLYGDDPLAYTRCEEFYNEKEGGKLSVGGFALDGLRIRCNLIDFDYYNGIAVGRKL